MPAPGDTDLKSPFSLHTNPSQIHRTKHPFRQPIPPKRLKTSSTLKQPRQLRKLHKLLIHLPALPDLLLNSLSNSAIGRLKISPCSHHTCRYCSEAKEIRSWLCVIIWVKLRSFARKVVLGILVRGLGLGWEDGAGR